MVRLHSLQSQLSTSSSDEDDDVETDSMKRQRYLHSSLEECSDPEYWMGLHYGNDDSPEMEVEDSVTGVDPEIERQFADMSASVRSAREAILEN